MKNTRGSEWNKWDLHIHTASSYDSPYKADDADELLCQALAENDIKAVVEAAKGKAARNGSQKKKSVRPMLSCSFNIQTL